jgi:hypothetical protein
MPRKLTIKHRKNNRRRSKTKGGGLGAVWEVYTNPKYKNNAIAFIRNPNNKWKDRVERKNNYVNVYGNPECKDVQFGEFKVNRWGGTDAGGCGFNIWDHNNTKFWIDVDPFFNIATKVKNESNCYFGVCTGYDDDVKNNVLFSIKPEENRTPYKTPNFFLKLFTSGYKVTDGGTTITEIKGAPPQQQVTQPPQVRPADVSGGNKKKTKKPKKNKKMKNQSKRKKLKK